jgi:hypothetical protein
MGIPNFFSCLNLKAVYTNTLITKTTVVLSAYELILGPKTGKKAGGCRFAAVTK